MVHTDDPRPPTDRWMALAASLVGGVSLLAGVGYGLEAAWRAALIGPAHAATAALLLGVAALVGGDRLWHGRWALPAAALSGAGMGVLYLTLFVCYGRFGWFHPAVAIALLLLVTGSGVVQAVRRDSQLMACLGLAGGLATPLVVGALAPEAAPFQALTVAVDLAVAAALTRRRWPVLAWLAVLGTAMVWVAGIAWGTALLPVVAAAGLVGLTFTLAAARTDALSVQLPLAVGVGTAFVAALGTVTVAPVGALAVATALLVLGRQSFVPWAAPIDHPVDSWTMTGPRAAAVAAAVLLAGAGATALLTQAVSPALASALWALPALAMWGSAALDRHPDNGETLPLGLAAATVATCATLLDGATTSGTVIALLGLALPMVALRWHERRLVAGTEWAVLLVPSLLGAAGAASLATGPSALPVALLGLGITLLLPRWVGDPEAHRTYLPLLGTLPWLGAASWQVADGPAAVAMLTGLPALAAGALALHLQQRADPESLAHRIYQGTAVALAALAVPLQLEREAWTIGWALLAAVLAWTVRGERRPYLQAASLTLAALVTARLVLNPSVLTYHLADGSPSLWVLYGYGVPLACLVAVERWVGRRRPWVQAAMAGVAFAGVNVAVSQLFHTEGALQLVDMTLHARVARTVGWGALGLGMLGLAPRWPTLRSLGIATLVAVVAKVVAFDLWVLQGASRAALLGGVAVCFLAAAGLLQRRPTPTPAVAR